MTFLKKIGYGFMIGDVILYVLKEWIDLMTYGELHFFIYFLFFGTIIYLVVAMIIELVRTSKQKLGNAKSNLIFVLCSIVFSVFFIFRPYKPHLFVTYEQVWVWKGYHNSRHKTDEPLVWSVFEARGKLKLANNGRFILTWRSLFNSWNYYGDWSFTGKNLHLSYHGRSNKRVGTDLSWSYGKLYAYNEKGDLAPQVILEPEN